MPLEPRAPAPTTFASALRREAVVVLVVGLPGVAYVLATNASERWFIAVHVVLLAVLAPLAVAALEVSVPSFARRGPAAGVAVARDVAVRLGGLAVATLVMVLGVSVLTRNTVANLLALPLAVALVPVFLAYATTALVLRWSHVREDALRLRTSEARARQEALAARVRPHFLFNALNGIEELTDTDPAAARVAVGRLARLLRAVLEASLAPTARIEDEARLVDDYFGIERLRFGERFAYRLDVEGDVAAHEVPSTVLLTLAENAVKHGVEVTSGAVLVHLAVRRAAAGGILVTVVSPTPQSPTARAEKGVGYGLRDVRERLALAYGGSATLTLAERGGETHVDLTLPG